MKRRLWLVMVLLGLVMPATAHADTTQLNGTYFNSGATATSTSGDDQAAQEPAHPLTIPQNTPVPLEGYRWKARRIKIYMETDDPKIRAAFRQAVKGWNATKAVKLVWTKHRHHAQVVASSADLTDQSQNNQGNQQVSQLGATETSYDPDTHAMLFAKSTLDPGMLDNAALDFRTEVAEHELGHALGLAHAREYQHSVMIPRNVRGGITKEDRQTIRQLYK